MAADQQQFLHLLSTLLSTDNTIRSNAEVRIVREEDCNNFPVFCASVTLT